MNKRAGLEIGINTVVILVIAMVVIAGGIAFIRGFFGKGTDALDQYFNSEDFPNQATSNEPVVFAQSSTFSIKSGDQATIPIGLYNTFESEKTFKITFDNCISNTAYPQDISHPKPRIIAALAKLEVGKPTVKKIFIEGEDPLITPTKLAQGNYICTLKVATEDGLTTLGTADAIIEITP